MRERKEAVLTAELVERLLAPLEGEAILFSGAPLLLVAGVGIEVLVVHGSVLSARIYRTATPGPSQPLAMRSLARAAARARRAELHRAGR